MSEITELADGRYHFTLTLLSGASAEIFLPKGSKRLKDSRLREVITREVRTAIAAMLSKCRAGDPIEVADHAFEIGRAVNQAAFVESLDRATYRIPLVEPAK